MLPEPAAPVEPTGAIDGTALQPADVAMADAIAATTETGEEPEAAAASTDEEEDLPPSTVHPSAAAGFTEADVDPEKGEFYIGMWYDKPNYGCPFCAFSTIEGSGAVELHILGKIDSGDIPHRAYVPSE